MLCPQAKHMAGCIRQMGVHRPWHRVVILAHEADGARVLWLRGVGAHLELAGRGCKTRHKFGAEALKQGVPVAATLQCISSNCFQDLTAERCRHGSS
jgi:hypothetical protein